MKNNELSLFPELTRSKMVNVSFGSNTPIVNTKYFFDYDLELKESKTVGVQFNPGDTTLYNKPSTAIGGEPIYLTSSEQGLYINLVDKDNNVVVENLPLNALYRLLYTPGQTGVAQSNSIITRKFDVEIDWAKSYVIWYASPGVIDGEFVSLTIYYKRKIQK
jgi:hypothetical protein